MITIVDIIRFLVSRFPGLKSDLRKAHIKQTPEIFMKKTAQLSLMFALVSTLIAFLFLEVAKISLMWLPLIFIAVTGLFFSFFMLSPKQVINKRRRELDREVLFAGRFLLVKIHSGQPLVNALVEGAQSYGVSSKYFKEIVDDLNLGTSIEDALDHAVRYSPSDKFRRILFQIKTAIKVGIDVAGPLQSTLEEITNEQLTDIQRYGKKLNSLALFYMLIAVVMPSLGMAMFLVIGGLVGFVIDRTMFTIVLFFLAVLQLIFLAIFKSTRLQVTL